MGPKTSQLCARLREASTLLQSAGEAHWTGWLEESLRRIENGDLSGIDHFLGAYGGMGSFNDLILARANGHTVLQAEQSAINERLAALRSAMYDLASEIRRDAQTR